MKSKIVKFINEYKTSIKEKLEKVTEFNKRLINRLRFRLSLAQGNILISVGKIRDEPIFGYTSNAIIL